MTTTDPSFTGLFPATVTPFDEWGGVDVDALCRHLAAVSSAPVCGLVVNGGIGEVFQLRQEERDTVVKEAARIRAAGQVLVAGIDATTADEACRQGEAAVAAGADALLVLPPFDRRPYRALCQDRAAVLEFFQALDRRLGVPVVVFQYPEDSGCAYPLPVLGELADLPAVRAVKVATPRVSTYVAAWETLRDRVAVLPAADSAPLLGMLLHGAHGALIGIAAVATQHWADLVHAAASGDHNRAVESYRRVCEPLMRVLFAHQQPAGAQSEIAATKEALRQMGVIPTSAVRPPLRQVTAERSAAIGSVLAEIGLLGRE